MPHGYGSATVVLCRWKTLIRNLDSELQKIYNKISEVHWLWGHIWNQYWLLLDQSELIFIFHSSSLRVTNAEYIYLTTVVYFKILKSGNANYLIMNFFYTNFRLQKSSKDGYFQKFETKCIRST
jgi:hypothetical protein